MKVFITSFHFPPNAPPAASRIGKLAKYLVSRGHDVRVLAARQDLGVSVYEPEIPEEHVTFTDWADVAGFPDQVIEKVAKLKPRPAVNGTSAPEQPKQTVNGSAKKNDGLSHQMLRFARKTYNSAFCVPDSKIGWLNQAVAAGKEILSEWQPDIVYATAPPPTTFLVAKKIAKMAGVPWIAEMRDLWIDNPYEDRTKVRRVLERPLEASVLNNADAFVTVSPIWKQELAERFSKETRLVYNGFEEAEYPLVEDTVAPQSDPLKLIYAGSIYPGRREPSAILEAMALLKHRVQDVEFTLAGQWMGDVESEAERLGVAESVRLLGVVSHKDVIDLQYKSDIQVLLQWNSPEDVATVPGKIFEYIAARRPILATGYRHSVTAEIIRRFNLGLLSNDPAEIAEFFDKKIDEKKSKGIAPTLPAEERSRFSRRVQFEGLVDWLEARY